MEMASTQQPTWMSYEPTKDCTLGLCSMYCPQWCYIIFPPPPSLEFSEDSSSPSLSPLAIAVIGILASAFLLVCYYTLASKYCGTFNSLRGRRQNSSGPQSQQHNEVENWPASSAPSDGGLDENLINKITVCKYRKGGGFVGATDCSVCLSEFKNDETLRLLPKCSHAFHVQCIDTWLKSHSNCPLCRASIATVNFATMMPVTENSCPVDQQVTESNEVSGPSEQNELSNTVEQMQGSADTGIEMRDDDHDDIELIRPSLSLDSSPCGRVLIADVLQISIEDEVAQ